MAELNTRAREWMAATGRLTGPEVTVDEVAYRAGDRVVALAPDHQAGLVTSQRATVTAVDPHTATVAIRTDDGRAVTLTADQLGPDRVRYAYSTTVHRSQGSTVDRTYLYADGGGRELAYVAMSRARETSTAWVVADDPDQAADDLTRDWAVRRTPTWAIDTGLPDPLQLAQANGARIAQNQRTGMSAILHARAATAAAAGRPGMPPSSNRLEETADALTAARAALARLGDGTGLDRHPTLGEAVHGDHNAQQRLDQLHDIVERGGWRERRAARRQLLDATEDAVAATQQLEALIDAEKARVRREVTALEAKLDNLTHQNRRAQQRWHTAVTQHGDSGQTAQLAGRYLDRVRHGLDHSGRIRATDPSGRGRNPVSRQPAAPAVGVEVAPAHEVPDL